MQTKSRNIIRSIRPELTEEERARRMKIIKDATVLFVLRAEADIKAYEERQKQAEMPAREQA